MFPVLFSIGGLSVSSFGVFLALAFLFGVFLIWRLSRAWDLDEEKVLDLTLATFIGGLIGARAYFVIEHFAYFTTSFLKLFLIMKYPGLDFVGGFLGGWLTLSYFVRRFKMDFWQIADIASVGLLGGLIVADIGCFLGGCNVGTPSKAFFAVTMTGQIGTRWPLQIIEALLFTFSMSKIWSQATHFHQRGKIVAVTFIYFGSIKLLLQIITQQKSYFFDFILFALGITIFYKVTRRNIYLDGKDTLKFMGSLFTSASSKKTVILYFKKSWYNQKAALLWKIRSVKKVLKKFNVKVSYKHS